MRFLRLIFGGGRNVITETAGAFVANAEASAEREAELNGAALAQYASEFGARSARTWFDSFVDGLNRLVRPMLTFAILLPIAASIWWPAHAAAAIASLAILPAGYWGVLGVVISFFFGGRMQIKAQDFERSVADAVARAPAVIQSMKRLRTMSSESPGAASSGQDATLAAAALKPSDNSAIDHWRAEELQRDEAARAEQETNRHG